MCYYTLINGSANTDVYTGIAAETTHTTTNTNNISINDYADSGVSYTSCKHNVTLPQGDKYRIYITDAHSEYKNNRAENWVVMGSFSIYYR